MEPGFIHALSAYSLLSLDGIFGAAAAACAWAGARWLLLPAAELGLPSLFSRKGPAAMGAADVEGTDADTRAGAVPLVIGGWMGILLMLDAPAFAARLSDPTLLATSVGGLLQAALLALSTVSLAALVLSALRSGTTGLLVLPAWILVWAAGLTAGLLTGPFALALAFHSAPRAVLAGLAEPFHALREARTP